MKRTHGRKRGLLACTGLFWSVLVLSTLFFTGGAAEVRAVDGGETLGKQYLAESFLTVSREGGGWQRVPLEPGTETEGESKPQTEGETGTDPVAGTTEIAGSDLFSEGVGEVVESIENLPQTGENEPLVLIYHTHASESYQPYPESNFHREEVEGTVREAGNVLAAALEAKGIGVIHDTTLHDRPSYDQSYSRSLETAKTLLQQYPSVTLVIDLHRDAAAYSGNTGHVFYPEEGTTAAQFALVVGQGNSNAAALNAFAKEIHQLANRLYPGFSRGIIEKDYRYNQYISDCHLLLELGNNQNSIQDIRRSAELFAEVVEEWLGR